MGVCALRNGYLRPLRDSLQWYLNSVSHLSTHDRSLVILYLEPTRGSCLLKQLTGSGCIGRRTLQALSRNNRNNRYIRSIVCRYVCSSICRYSTIYTYEHIDKFLQILDIVWASNRASIRVRDTDEPLFKRFCVRVYLMLQKASKTLSSHTYRLKQ